MDSDAVEKAEKTAKHYGRAYQCLGCLYKDGKVEIDVKRRMTAHITKYHLSLDQVGYFCQLCSFRCWERRELDQHIEGYAPHKKEAVRLGKDPKDAAYLVDTRTTYRIGEADYKVLSQKESRDFFRKKGMRKVEETPARTPIGTPMRTPVQVEGMDDILGQAVRQSNIREAEIAAAILERITAGEAGHKDSEGAAIPSSSTREEEPEAARTREEEQTTPLDLVITLPVEENILGQLLGETEVVATPFADPPPEDQPRKESRQEREEQPPSKHRRSVSPAPSEASTTSSASSSSSITAEQWQQMGAAIVKPLLTAIDSNTRAIRQMGKTMEENTRAIEVIARACKGMQEVLEGGVRRRRDDRREESKQPSRHTR